MPRHLVGMECTPTIWTARSSYCTCVRTSDRSAAAAPVPCGADVTLSLARQPRAVRVGSEATCDGGSRALGAICPRRAQFRHGNAHRAEVASGAHPAAAGAALLGGRGDDARGAAIWVVTIDRTGQEHRHERLISEDPATKGCRQSANARQGEVKARAKTVLTLRLQDKCAYGALYL